MDAFCAEVSASSRRDRVCDRSLRCAAHVARRYLRVSRRRGCRPVGTSARIHYFQCGLYHWLRARSAYSKLGRRYRWNVSVPVVELFFVARNVFTGWRGARSKSPLDGYRRSVRHQTVADHDCAILRRNVDRSVWNYRWRTNRARHFNFALGADDFAATTTARRTLCESNRSRRCSNHSTPRAVEFLAKLARVQSADATVALKRHTDPLLRASAVRVGGDFCDGLHRRQRSAGRHLNRDRNARRYVVHHSCLALCGSIQARAVRDRDLHYVHAVSNQSAGLSKFFGAGNRVCNPWVKRVRRYIAQGPHHRIQ